MIKTEVWMFSVVFAGIAGWTDWRWRRIPNWLTVPVLLSGIVVNAWMFRWSGMKEALLGAGLGLLVLLPFVLLRSLGAGDWKLVGALGAWLGPSRLIAVLILAMFVAGLMAAILVIWKRRMRQTLLNIWHLLVAFVTFRSPGQELSLDNPESAKVPFGVAVALAVLVVAAGQAWRS
jgi:prepilin peptidase CpaA